jgi:chemotaxis protein histidine kinase CheA
VSIATTPPLARQVARARTRLFLQQLLRRLTDAWIAGLGLAAVWLLVEPYLRPQLASAWRPHLAGLGLAILATLATAAGVLLALRRRPSALDASLMLDRRCGLAERVTTALHLTESERDTPAGRALRADAERAAGSLHVSEAFPVSLPRRAFWLPAGVVALVAIAVFYEPPSLPAQAEPGEEPALASADKAVVDRKLQALLPKPKPRQVDAAVKSEKLEQLEADLAKLVERPRSTPEQLRDRLKEMTPLEEALKKQAREQAERTAAVQQQLKQLDKMSRRGKDASAKPDKDSAVKPLEDALSRGDTEQAKEEVARLKKKLKSDTLTEQEKKDVQEQLKDLQEKLERLSKQEDAKSRLKQLADEGKIDSETLDKEIAKLDKQAKEQLQDLRDVADKLAQAQKALKEAEGKEGGEREAAEKKAQQALEDLAEKLDEMQQAGHDVEELENKLQRLNDARDAMQKACKNCKGGGKGKKGEDDEDLGDDAERLTRDDGKGQGDKGDGGDDADSLSRKDGDGDGDGEGEGMDGDGGRLQREGDRLGKGKGKGGRGQGAGRRPEKKGGTSSSVDAKQQGQFDPKGQKKYDGAAPGEARRFSKRPAAELSGEIRQATQEAPEAIEVQRIPKAARDMAKGFFRNLGGQAEPAPAKPAAPAAKP